MNRSKQLTNLNNTMHYLRLLPYNEKINEIPLRLADSQKSLNNLLNLFKIIIKINNEINRHLLC